MNKVTKKIATCAIALALAGSVGAPIAASNADLVHASEGIGVVTKINCMHLRYTNYGYNYIYNKLGKVILGRLHKPVWIPSGTTFKANGKKTNFYVIGKRKFIFANIWKRIPHRGVCCKLSGSNNWVQAKYLPKVDL